MKDVVTIDINKIIASEDQLPLDFNDDKIRELANSNEEIIVRQVNDKYELVTGEKKLKACQLLGQLNVDVIIIDEAEEEAARKALIENVQRENLNAIDQAIAMRSIMKEDGITQDELAKRLGFKQSTVANKIRLLKLPQFVKDGIINNKISERHARALLRVPSDKLEEAYNTIISRNYNVAKTEEYINNLTEKKKIKGVTGNVQVGVNTIKQAYDMCRKAGIDADFKTTDYEDSLKITITIKKLG